MNHIHNLIICRIKQKKAPDISISSQHNKIIFIILIAFFLFCIISLPDSFAANYITNGQFLNNIENWSEVEITNPSYGTTSWNNTGQANGGSIKGATVQESNYVWEAYNNQTTQNIEQNSTINLSFQWMGGYINREPGRFNLTVSIKRPDSSIVRLWDFQGIPVQGWDVWTGENIDVSSFFNQNGSYEFRLYYYFTTYGPPGGAVYGYYDEIILNVTPPDRTAPNITIIAPEDNITLNSNIISITYNLSDDNGIKNCTLYIDNQYNASNNTINKSLTQNFTVTGITEGSHNWSIECTDDSLFENKNRTQERTINIDTTGPIILLISPQNNTAEYTNTITFRYNVSDSNNVSSCDIVIDSIVMNSTTTTPVPKNTQLEFYATINSGLHNWSVNCTDIYNNEGYSDIRNISIILPPSIDQISVTDNLYPEEEIILAAGGMRTIDCFVTASDSLGVSNLDNALATFYYNLNLSTDTDDNNVHYTDNDCEINNTNPQNQTFKCSFDVSYYANSGLWQCNATVYNKQSGYDSENTSAIIQELYAINISEGINFGNVEQGFISSETTASITNLGNKNVNVSIQGFAVSAGDGKGMDCSDGGNISLELIRFSDISTEYYSKTALDGFAQKFGPTITKQTSGEYMSALSYWQIMVNPQIGINERNCSGTLLFIAEVP